MKLRNCVVHAFFVGMLAVMAVCASTASAVVQGKPVELPEYHVLQPAPEGVAPNVQNNIQLSSPGGNDAYVEDGNTNDSSPTSTDFQGNNHDLGNTPNAGAEVLFGTRGGVIPSAVTYGVFLVIALGIGYLIKRYYDSNK